MSKSSDSLEAKVTYGTSSVNQDLQESGVETLEVVTDGKARCIRNLILISFSYFLFFSGFWSLTNLQSTMNAQQGMGVDSQAVIYFCSMLSCFLPTFLVEKFGSKTTFLVSVLISCSYLAANIHLRWDALIAGSVIYGLASGPLNAAISVYIDEMAKRYERLGGGSREKVESIFFGIYMMFNEFTQVLGNSISSYILRENNIHHHHNHSVHYNCGVSFHVGENNQTNSNLTPPSETQRFWLIGTYLALGLVAVLFAALVDPLRNDVKDIRGCDSVVQRFLSAVKHLRNPHQILLVLLSVYCGMEGPFYSNEFTEAFIGCSWGIQHVGYVSVCFGLVAAIVSIIVGPLVKWTSLMFVIVLVAVLNLVTYALLFVWKPSPDTPSLYFVFGGLFGCADAIWWSQLPALYGLMFPENREAAYSNFFFWSFLGYFISYTYANFLSIVIKLYILFAVLISGITCFLISHIMKKRSSTYATILESDVSE